MSEGRLVGQNLEAPPTVRSQPVPSEEGPGAGAAQGPSERAVLSCLVCSVRCWHFQLSKGGDGGIGPKGGFCFKCL